MQFNPDPDLQNFVKIDYEHWEQDHDVHIVNPKIVEIYVDNLINEYLEIPEVKNKQNIVLNYCIDRCVNHNGVANPENWTIELREFYYGDEVKSVYFDNHDDVLKDINKLVSLKDSGERIEYTLEKEYGHVLSCVKNKRWLTLLVDKNSIIIGNQEHYETLDSDLIERYEDRELPACLVIPEDKKFRLIDGYHRLAGARDKSKISVLVGEHKWGSFAI